MTPAKTLSRFSHVPMRGSAGDDGGARTALGKPGVPDGGPDAAPLAEEVVPAHKERAATSGGGAVSHRGPGGGSGGGGTGICVA